MATVFRLAGRAIVFLGLAASPALAQDSSALIRTKVAAQYQLIKSMMQQEFPGYPGAVDPNASYDLTGCASISPRLSAADAAVQNVISLAAEMVLVAKTLTWAGYPPAVWQASVNAFERKQLALLAKRPSADKIEAEFQTFGRPFMQQLDRYRKSSRTKLPELSWWSVEGCGGHGRPITIKTSPEKGRLRIMPAFYHNLCKAQKVDADDPDKCNHGIDVNDGEQVLLSGKYQYIATWPGGLKQRGRQDFDSLPENVEDWTVRYASE